MGNQQERITDIVERDAILGLWAIPGAGPVSMRRIEQAVGGSLRGIADVRVGEWLPLLPKEALTETPRNWLIEAETLRSLGAHIRRLAEAAHMNLAYPGDAGYPENLARIDDRPAVLFYRGVMAAPRKRIALVGTRRYDVRFKTAAERFAVQVAANGFGVVSGAARGIDELCHAAALGVGGETWAFIGSSLDEMDPAQRRICDGILQGGGMVFTEYPPKTRAEKSHFPRRNRLISGASDAVVVVRAPEESGSWHTASYALKQGRPLLAVPGEFWKFDAAGCNQWIAEGRARLCRGVEDIRAALNIKAERMADAPAVGVPVGDLGLSEEALKVLEALPRHMQDFDEVQAVTQLDPSQLLIALSELEVHGLAVQHPGKRYERV